MKDNKIFTERLKILMDGLSIRAFANLVEGISEGTVRRALKGEVSDKTIWAISRTFEIDDTWLTGEPDVGRRPPEHMAEKFEAAVNGPPTTGAFEELKHKTAPVSGKVSTPIDIPVIGKVPAGVPETNEWEIEYNIQVPGMPPHCYAMKVTGDSMEPRIMEGEHVIFTLDYTLESGNVVIVTDEYGDSMVKRYKVKDGVKYLVSDNSKYPPVKPNGGFHIVGKVINSVLIKRH